MQEYLMVAAIGSGVGNMGVSLARAGPGDHKAGPSDHSKPIGGSDRRENGTIDNKDSDPASNDDSHAVNQARAFETILRTFAFQFVNDALAETDEAMDEFEENA
jgi:hypothetical protein